MSRLSIYEVTCTLNTHWDEIHGWKSGHSSRKCVNDVFQKSTCSVFGVRAYCFGICFLASLLVSSLIRLKAKKTNTFLVQFLRINEGWHLNLNLNRIQSTAEKQKVQLWLKSKWMWKTVNDSDLIIFMSFCLSFFSFLAQSNIVSKFLQTNIPIKSSKKYFAIYPCFKTKFERNKKPNESAYKKITNSE